MINLFAEKEYDAEQTLYEQGRSIVKDAHVLIATPSFGHGRACLCVYA